MNGDAELARKLVCHCDVDPCPRRQVVERLVDRLDAAEAALARVNALADEWEAEDHPTSTIIANELRAALESTE